MKTTAEEFFKAHISVDSIKALVGSSEDLYFEAKRTGVPMQVADKKKLAKAISSFANAAGGTIIYGLEAVGGNQSKADVVQRAPGTKQLSILRSQVLSFIGQILEPPVPGIEVQSVRTDDQDNGFLCVFVPASDIGPHRSRLDREYYRRHGFGSYPMENFEIAEMFHRGVVPDLSLILEPRAFQPFVINHQLNHVTLSFVLKIKNEGRGIAKYPAIRLSPKRSNMYGLDGNSNNGLKRLATSGDEDFFSGGADIVIYPGAEHEVTVIEHRFSVVHNQWPDLILKYEIFADVMVSKRGQIIINGAEQKERHATSS